MRLSFLKGGLNKKSDHLIVYSTLKQGLSFYKKIMFICTMRYLWILSALFLSSCDCTYDYTYVVQNNTDDSIKVYWEHINFEHTNTIPSGATEQIIITSHGVEDCDNGPFFQDVEEDLKAINVSKNGDTSTLDYRENAQWMYSNGKYETTVSESEF